VPRQRCKHRSIEGTRGNSHYTYPEGR
jgi:hypothetical protein